MKIAVVFCVLAVVVCLAPMRWGGATTEPEPVFSGSCASRYNALLSQAKTALTDHDRSRAVSLLTESRQILENCAEIQDGPERESQPVLARNQISAPTPLPLHQGQPADRS
jgi:hypothetical protein